MVRASSAWYSLLDAPGGFIDEPPTRGPLLIQVPVWRCWSSYTPLLFSEGCKSRSTVNPVREVNSAECSPWILHDPCCWDIKQRIIQSIWKIQTPIHVLERVSRAPPTIIRKKEKQNPGWCASRFKNRYRWNYFQRSLLPQKFADRTSI